MRTRLVVLVVLLVSLITTVSRAPADEPAQDLGTEGASTRATDLPTQYLPTWGGSGGTAFSRSCGAGRVLSGVRGRAGLVVDALGLLCRSVGADGSLGPESSIGTLAGGGGGTPDVASCPRGTVVSGVTISHGSFVNSVAIFCRAWDKATRKMTGPGTGIGVIGGGAGTQSPQACESASQPMSGFRGRAATLIDAVGFNCNEP